METMQNYSKPNNHGRLLSTNQYSNNRRFDWFTRRPSGLRAIKKLSSKNHIVFIATLFRERFNDNNDYNDFNDYNDWDRL
jgi:hypothetical protein